MGDDFFSEPICQSSAASLVIAGTKATEIDNSMFGKSLQIELSSSSPIFSVFISFYFEGSKIELDLPFCQDGPVIRVELNEILKALPLLSHGKVIIEGKETKKTVPLKRKGILSPPNKELSPVYAAMADDVKKFGYVLAVVPTVLWDAAFTGEGFLPNGGRSRWADGTNPETNLNWGNGTGTYAMLKADRGWQLVYEEKNKKSPIRRAVFAKEVKPSPFWRSKGIEKPFTFYLALEAYTHLDILKGYQRFARLVTGSTSEEITLKDGKKLPLATNRVVGLSSHYTFAGRKMIGKSLQAASPKAVYMANCFSAPMFGPLLARENIFPLLLSIPTTTAEGYVQLPLIEGLIRGRNAAQLLSDVSASYYSFHQRHTGYGQFTNPSGSNYERALSNYDLDWDGDNVVNQLDPEPLKTNHAVYDKPARELIVTASDGGIIRIGLTADECPGFFSACGQ